MQVLEPQVSRLKQGMADKAPACQRMLVVHCLQASGLRDTDLFGGIDPYCRLTLGTRDLPDGPQVQKPLSNPLRAWHVNLN